MPENGEKTNIGEEKRGTRKTVWEADILCTQNPQQSRCFVLQPSSFGERFDIFSSNRIHLCPLVFSSSMSEPEQIDIEQYKAWDG